MNSEIAQSRAAYGGRVFDETFGPGWIHYIDVDALDIQDPNTCAIAQLASKHPRFAAAVKKDICIMQESDKPENASLFDSGWMVCFEKQNLPEIIQMGCCIDEETTSNYAAEYEMLTTAWIGEIYQRMMNAARPMQRSPDFAVHSQLVDA